MAFARNPNALSDAELARLLEEDDDDIGGILVLEDDDDEESDHLYEEEEIDDEIEGQKKENEQETGNNASADDSDGDSYKSNPKYSTKDKDIEWSKCTLNTRVRRLQANVLKTPEGLTAYGSQFDTVAEAFFLFFTPEVINIIVTETNRKAHHHFSKWNIEHPEKVKKFVPTNETEIKAYIGLLITMGALQASGEAIHMLWSTDPAYCRPIIPACMSRNRYKILTCFLRFDNFETRLERKVTDKLAPIREVFDMLVSNCKKAYNPGTHVCIDEQLVPFRGRAPFRVYMKSKPDKYGLKIWALADCELYYTLNMQVYLGKIQLIVEYCIYFFSVIGKQNEKAEVGQGQRVVLDLTSHLGKGYGLTTDNFFTSLPLADKLWEKNITLVGTLRKDKKYIPTDLLPKPYKPVFSSMFAFRKKRTLVSYVPKKNRAVIMLSSEHTDDKVSGEEHDYKPDIILHYNSTKGAVDTVDKMAKQYSCQRKTNRWPMAIFQHLLDIAGINAFKLWTIKNPEWKKKQLDRRRLFLLQLGKDLMYDHVAARHRNPIGLHSIILKYIITAFPNLEVANEEREAEEAIASQGRCYLCPRSRDRKSRKYCLTCKKFVCQAHSNPRIVHCRNCAEKKLS